MLLAPLNTINKKDNINYEDFIRELYMLSGLKTNITITPIITKYKVNSKSVKILTDLGYLRYEKRNLRFYPQAQSINYITIQLLSNLKSNNPMAASLTTKIKYDDFLLELEKLTVNKKTITITNVMKEFKINSWASVVLKDLGHLKYDRSGLIFDSLGLGIETITDNLVKGIKNKQDKAKNTAVTITSNTELAGKNTINVSNTVDNITEIMIIGSKYKVPLDLMKDFVKDILLIKSK